MFERSISGAAVSRSLLYTEFVLSVSNTYSFDDIEHNVINKYDLTKNSSFVANIDGTDREYTVTQSTDGYQFTGKDANGNQVTYTVKYDAKGNGKVYDSNNRVVKNDIPTIRENPTQINENTPVITNTTAAERNRERVAMEIHKLDQLNDTNVPTNSNITPKINASWRVPASVFVVSSSYSLDSSNIRIACSFFTSAPFFIFMYFISCPPISTMLVAFGMNFFAAV